MQEIKINAYYDKLDDRIEKSSPYGKIPPINGEYFIRRRTFNFRVSTIRSLNKLKVADSNINIHLSTIVDLAINYYCDYVFNNKHNQK